MRIIFKQVRGSATKNTNLTEHSSGNHDHVPLFLAFLQNIFQQILGNFTEIFLTGNKTSNNNPAKMKAF